VVTHERGEASSRAARTISGLRAHSVVEYQCPRRKSRTAGLSRNAPDEIGRLHPLRAGSARDRESASGSEREARRVLLSVSVNLIYKIG